MGIMESTPNHKQPHRIAGNIAPTESVSLGDSLAIIPLQKVLALHYYHLQHPDIAIDPVHPDTVDRQTRNDAMQLWLEGGDEGSVSAQFRTYAETHPDELVTPSDEASLMRIFAELNFVPDSTVH